MIYTDGIHLVADDLNELHKFAFKINLKRQYYHGVRKGHPHYDLVSWKNIPLWDSDTKQTFIKKVYGEGAIYKSSKEILLISQKMLTSIEAKQTTLF